MNFRQKIKNDRHFRIGIVTVTSLVLNISYAVYNGYLGVASHSVWFGVMFAYYLLLSVMRIYVVTRSDIGRKSRAMFVGVCLIFLGLVLGGINYLSEAKHLAVKYSTIPMITIATYTFYKIVMSALRAVKYHGKENMKIECINVIGYAEMAVSILSMQRSMLVSFEGMSEKSIRIFNVTLGSVVWIFILALGIYLINKKENKHGKIKTH